MTIGTLGDIAFYASSEALQTFEDLQRKSSVSYAEHKLHKKKPMLELTSFNADEVSFEMNLSVLLGSQPNKVHSTLIKMMNDGRIATLVIGTTVIGTSWVITNVSQKFKTLYKDGRLISCEVSVTLKEYN